MKYSTTIIALFLAFGSLGNTALAQSDLQVFGFFQGLLSSLDGKYSVVASMPTSTGGVSPTTLAQQTNSYTSPSIQQLNLFFRKELTSNITAWVNFEVLGNYNSVSKWGSYSLEEAWANYQYNDALNVKAGLLIPRFAYLNEIKNRMPLLPYITRPLVYEASNNTINATDFIPERAFAQVSGYFHAGAVTFDYAAFVGPSEKLYISGGGATGGASTDTSKFKLVGGRIGAKYGELRAGVSGTIDRDNQQATIKEDVPRTRYAFDLGYSAYGFFADGEYIAVLLDAKNTTMDQNKVFYYGTLGYNITDAAFVYGSYSYLKDNNDNVLKAGMTGLIAGVGYKPADAFVIKAGYSTYTADSSFPLVVDPRIPAVNTKVSVDYKLYQLAVSVLF